MSGNFAIFSTFIRRRQSSDFYRRLLGPVLYHVLINRASKERALHQVIKYSHGTILWIVDHLTTNYYTELAILIIFLYVDIGVWLLSNYKRLIAF